MNGKGLGMDKQKRMKSLAVIMVLLVVASAITVLFSNSEAYYPNNGTGGSITYYLGDGVFAVDENGDISGTSTSDLAYEVDPDGDVTSELAEEVSVKFSTYFGLKSTEYNPEFWSGWGEVPIYDGDLGMWNWVGPEYTATWVWDSSGEITVSRGSLVGDVSFSLPAEYTLVSGSTTIPNGSPSTTITVSVNYSGQVHKVFGGWAYHGRPETMVYPGEIVSLGTTELDAKWVNPVLYAKKTITLKSNGETISGVTPYAELTPGDNGVLIVDPSNYYCNTLDNAKTMFNNIYWLDGTRQYDLSKDVSLPIGTYRTANPYNVYDCTTRSEKIDYKAVINTWEGFNTSSKDNYGVLGADVIIDNISLRANGENTHGGSTRGAISANGHRLILGTNISTVDYETGGIGQTDKISRAPAIFGGSVTNAIDTKIQTQTVYLNDSKKNSFNVDLGTFLIIHSGVYNSVIAGGLTTIGSQGTPLSTYAVLKDCIVMDTVGGGGGGTPTQGNVYGHINERSGYVDGGTFLYATSLFTLGDQWQDSDTGYMTTVTGKYASETSGDYKANGNTRQYLLNQQSSVVQGGCHQGHVYGSSHLIITGHSSVWDCMGGGREADSVTDSAYLEITGKAEVRRVACGTITDGSSNNYACVGSAAIYVAEDALVASVYGAGFDTWAYPSGRSMISGTINVTIAGGTIGDVFGGGYRGSIGDPNHLDSLTVNITVLGDDTLIKGNVYGGGSGGLNKIKHYTDGTGFQTGNGVDGNKKSTGKSYVYGNVNVDIQGGHIEGDVYGGGMSVPKLTKYDGSRVAEGEFIAENTDVATVYGDVSVKVRGNAVIDGNVFGAGQGIKLDSEGNVDESEYGFNKVIYKEGNSRTIDRQYWVKGGDQLSKRDYDNTVNYTNYAQVRGNITVEIENSSWYHGRSAVIGSEYTVSSSDADTVRSIVLHRGETLPTNYNIVKIDGSNVSMEYNKAESYEVTGVQNWYVNGRQISETIYPVSGTDADYSRTIVLYKDPNPSGKFSVIMIDGQNVSAVRNVSSSEDISLETSHIKKSVYGGGGFSKVYGTTMVNIDSGIVGENVFGGGLGISGHTSVEGNRAVFVEHNSSIVGSVYGGSEAGEDGPKTATSESDLHKNRSLVVIETGFIGGSVFGGGLMGKTYGDTDVYVGYYLTSLASRNPMPNDYSESRGIVISLDSVFAGGNISTDESVVSQPYTESLVQGTGNVKIYGNTNQSVNIKGSVMGSGNACLTNGKTTIEIENLYNPNKMGGIHRADEVLIINSMVGLEGRSSVTEVFGQKKIVSIFSVKELTLIGGSTISFDTPIDDIGSLKSLTSDGMQTTEKSPLNRMVFNNGTTAYIRSVENGVLAYRSITGFVQMVSSMGTYGAYAMAMAGSPGGFSVVSDGSMKEASTSISDNTCCWFMSGISKKISTLNLQSELGGLQLVKDEGLITITKFQSDTEIMFTGGVFTKLSNDPNGDPYTFVRPGSESINDNPNQLSLAIGYPSTVGTLQPSSGIVLYDPTSRSMNISGGSITDNVQGTFFKKDSRESDIEDENRNRSLVSVPMEYRGNGSRTTGPFDIYMCLSGKPIDGTAYVGYLTLIFQEVKQVNYESVTETGGIVETPKYLVANTIEVRVDIYIYGSPEAANSETFTVEVKTTEDVDGNLEGESSTLIPQSYELASINLVDVSLVGAGSRTMYDIGLADSTTYTLPECRFIAPVGKSFDQWRLSSGKDEGYKETFANPGDEIEIVGTHLYINDVDKGEFVTGKKLNITPKWTKTVQFFFDPNGGSVLDDMHDMPYISLASGIQYTVPSCEFNPPLSTKIFSGWSITVGSDRAEIRYPGEVITVEGDTVFKAIWVAKHEMTFAANGGSGTIDPMYAGDRFEVPDCKFSAPANKLFKYWTSSTGTYYPGQIIKVTGDMEFTAYWVSDSSKYTIEFDENGGEGTMPSVDVADGSRYCFGVCTSEAPAGKIFSAWSVTMGGVKLSEYKPGDYIRVSGDITAVAIWTLKQTVSLSQGIHAVGPTAYYYEPYEYEFVVPALPNTIVPSKLCKVDGESSFTFPAGETSYSVTIDKGETDVDVIVTLPDGFTVDDKRSFTIPANETSKVVTIYRAAAGSAVVIQLPTYEFDHWVDDRTGVSYYPNQVVKLRDNLNLVAVCVPSGQKSLVVFDPNGGDGYMPTLKKVNGSTYKIPNFEYDAPDGSVFSCWNVSVDGGAFTLMNPGETVFVSGDVMLKAVWVEKTESPLNYYTIKIQEDNGVETKPTVVIDIKQNAYYLEPANIFDAPENKAFNGWNVVGTYTDNKVRSDLVFYPKWTESSNVLDFESGNTISGKIIITAEPNQDNTTGWSNIGAPVVWNLSGNAREGEPYIGTLLGNIVGNINFQVVGLSATDSDNEPFLPKFDIRYDRSGKEAHTILTIEELQYYSIVFFDRGIQSEVYYPENTILTREKCQTPSGDNFNGWFLDSQFVNRYDYNMVVNDESDGMSLYARYTFIVTLDNMNGTTYTLHVSEEDDGVLLSEKMLPTPVYIGYEFAGWCKDKELIYDWGYQSDRVTEDTTLYARWIGEEVRIYFWFKDSSGNLKLFDGNAAGKGPKEGKEYDLQNDAWKLIDDGNRILYPTVRYGDTFNVRNPYDPQGRNLLDYAQQTIDFSGQFVRWTVVSPSDTNKHVSIYMDTVIGNKVLKYVSEDDVKDYDGSRWDYYYYYYHNSDGPYQRLLDWEGEKPDTMEIHLLAETTMVAIDVQMGLSEEDLKFAPTVTIDDPEKFLVYPNGPNRDNSIEGKYMDEFGGVYELDSSGEFYWNSDHTVRYYYDVAKKCWSCLNEDDAAAIRSTMTEAQYYKTISFPKPGSAQQVRPIKLDDKYGNTSDQKGNYLKSIVYAVTDSKEDTYLVEWNVDNKSFKVRNSSDPLFKKEITVVDMSTDTLMYYVGFDNKIYSRNGTTELSLAFYTDKQHQHECDWSDGITTVYTTSEAVLIYYSGYTKVGDVHTFTTRHIGEGGLDFYLKDLAGKKYKVVASGNPTMVLQPLGGGYYEFKYQLNNATRGGYTLIGWHNQYVSLENALTPSPDQVRTIHLWEGADGYVDHAFLYSQDASGNDVETPLLIGNYIVDPKDADAEGEIVIVPGNYVMPTDLRVKKIIGEREEGDTVDLGGPWNGTWYGVAGENIDDNVYTVDPDDADVEGNITIASLTASPSLSQYVITIVYSDGSRYSEIKSSGTVELGSPGTDYVWKTKESTITPSGEGGADTTYTVDPDDADILGNIVIKAVPVDYTQSSFTVNVIRGGYGVKSVGDTVNIGSPGTDKYWYGVADEHIVSNNYTVYASDADIEGTISILSSGSSPTYDVYEVTVVNYLGERTSVSKASGSSVSLGSPGTGYVWRTKVTSITPAGDETTYTVSPSDSDVLGDIVIKAVPVDYSIKEYFVKIKKDGIEYKNSVTIESLETERGFAGWIVDTDEQTGGEYQVLQRHADDYGIIVLKSEWKETAPYKVIWRDVWGSQADKRTDLDLKEGDTVLPFYMDDDPTKGEFLGWKARSGMIEDSYTVSHKDWDGTLDNEGYRVIVIKTVWENATPPTRYTVVFATDMGTIPANVTDRNPNARVELPILTADGYRHMGWKVVTGIDPRLIKSSVYYVSEDDADTQNQIIMVAEWTETYSVVINGDAPVHGLIAGEIAKLTFVNPNDTWKVMGDIIVKGGQIIPSDNLVSMVYEARWNQIPYSVNIVKPTNGNIDVFLESRSGDGTSIRLTYDQINAYVFHYGDKLRISYTPDSDNVAFIKWILNGQYYISSVSDTNAIVVVQGDCSIVADESTERLVDIMIAFDDGNLNEFDRKYTRVFIHDRYRDDSDPKAYTEAIFVPGTVKMDHYVVKVPYGDNYEVCIRYGETSPAADGTTEFLGSFTKADEYVLVGDVVVSMKQSSSLVYDVISAGFLNSIDTENRTIIDYVDTEYGPLKRQGANDLKFDYLYEEVDSLTLPATVKKKTVTIVKAVTAEDVVIGLPPDCTVDGGATVTIGASETEKTVTIVKSVSEPRTLVLEDTGCEVYAINPDSKIKDLKNGCKFDVVTGSGYPVRILDSSNNVVASVTKYVGILRSDLARLAAQNYHINNPDGGTPPVVMKVKPGYTYTTYEGFPWKDANENNVFAIATKINLAVEADSNLMISKTFYLNWVRTDSPADIIVHIRESPIPAHHALLTIKKETETLYENLNLNLGEPEDGYHVLERPLEHINGYSASATSSPAVDPEEGEYLFVDGDTLYIKLKHELHESIDVSITVTYEKDDAWYALNTIAFGHNSIVYLKNSAEIPTPYTYNKAWGSTVNDLPTKFRDTSTSTEYSIVAWAINKPDGQIETIVDSYRFTLKDSMITSNFTYDVEDGTGSIAKIFKQNGAIKYYMKTDGSVVDTSGKTASVIFYKDWICTQEFTKEDDNPVVYTDDRLIFTPMTTTDFITLTFITPYEVMDEKGSKRISVEVPKGGSMSEYVLVITQVQTVKAFCDTYLNKYAYDYILRGFKCGNESLNFDDNTPINISKEYVAIWEPNPGKMKSFTYSVDSNKAHATAMKDAVDDLVIPAGKPYETTADSEITITVQTDSGYAIDLEKTRGELGYSLEGTDLWVDFKTSNAPALMSNSFSSWKLWNSGEPIHAGEDVSELISNARGGFLVYVANWTEQPSVSGDVTLVFVQGSGSVPTMMHVKMGQKNVALPTTLGQEWKKWGSGAAMTIYSVAESDVKGGFIVFVEESVSLSKDCAVVFATDAGSITGPNYIDLDSYYSDDNGSKYHKTAKDTVYRYESVDVQYTVTYVAGQDGQFIKQFSNNTVSYKANRNGEFYGAVPLTFTATFGGAGGTLSGFTTGGSPADSYTVVDGIIKNSSSHEVSIALFKDAKLTQRIADPASLTEAKLGGTTMYGIPMEFTATFGGEGGTLSGFTTGGSIPVVYDVSDNVITDPKGNVVLMDLYKDDGLTKKINDLASLKSTDLTGNKLYAVSAYSMLRDPVLGFFTDTSYTADKLYGSEYECFETSFLSYGISHTSGNQYKDTLGTVWSKDENGELHVVSVTVYSFDKSTNVETVHAIAFDDDDPTEAYPTSYYYKDSYGNHYMGNSLTNQKIGTLYLKKPGQELEELDVKYIFQNEDLKALYKEDSDKPDYYIMRNGTLVNNNSERSVVDGTLYTDESTNIPYVGDYRMVKVDSGYNTETIVKKDGITYHRDTFGNLYYDWLGSPTQLSGNRGFSWTFFLKDDLNMVIYTKPVSYNINFIVNGVKVKPTDLNSVSTVASIGYIEDSQEFHGADIPQYAIVAFGGPNNDRGITWYTDPEYQHEYDVHNSGYLLKPSEFMVDTTLPIAPSSAHTFNKWYLWGSGDGYDPLQGIVLKSSGETKYWKGDVNNYYYVLEAKWSDAPKSGTYKIVYASNYGSLSGNLIVTSDTTETIPYKPLTEKGKTFNGWKVWNTGDAITESKTVAQLLTIHAAIDGYILLVADWEGEEVTNANNVVYASEYGNVPNMESIRKYQFMSTRNLSLYAHSGTYVLYLHDFDDNSDKTIKYELAVDEFNQITIPADHYSLGNYTFVGWSSSDHTWTGEDPDKGKRLYTYAPQEKINVSHISDSIDLYPFYLSDGSDIKYYDGNAADLRLCLDELLSSKQKLPTTGVFVMQVRYSEKAINSLDDGDEDPVVTDAKHVGEYESYYYAQLRTPYYSETDAHDETYGNTKATYEFPGHSTLKILKVDAYVVAPSVYIREGEGRIIVVGDPNPENLDSQLEELNTVSQPGDIIITSDDVMLIGIVPGEVQTINLGVGPQVLADNGQLTVIPQITFKGTAKPALDYNWQYINGTLLIYPADSSKYESEGYV